MISIRHLYRYPVKGLSGEALQRVALAAGQGFPCDRQFALARPETAFDPAAPEPAPKQKFLMLMRDARLASLATAFDDATGVLTVQDGGGATLVQGSLHDADGRAAVEGFFAGFMGDEIDGAPRVVQATGHQFTDVSVVSETMMRAVSLINLASLRELEQAAGKPLHHLRFRANLYFDGGGAWSEFDWMDREISVGGVPMRVIYRTQRCAATQVNPLTAERDVNVPAEIVKHFGHRDLGVYAEVLGDGDISVGGAVEA